MTNDIDRLAISTSMSTFRSANSSPLPSPYLKVDNQVFPGVSYTCFRGASAHQLHVQAPFNLRSPEEMVAARNALLATLPVPPGIPEEELKPIMIPAPFTIHEFLGNTTGVSR